MHYHLNRIDGIESFESRPPGGSLSKNKCALIVLIITFNYFKNGTFSQIRNHRNYERNRDYAFTLPMFRLTGHDPEDDSDVVDIVMLVN